MATTALDFTYAAPAARVVLGAGRAREVAAELDLLGIRRALVACTPSGVRRYDDIISALGGRCAVFAKAEAHCPLPIAQEALEAFVAHGADGIVTIGGGSSTELGKFIAAKRGAPLLAIPTTLSGSEMTSLYGVKIGNEKRTSNDIAARPRAVIYDPALTETLPAHETAATGMNCLAHCVEALYPAQPNPVARLLALEGIRSLAASLPGVIERNDVASRARALLRAFRRNAGVEASRKSRSSAARRAARVIGQAVPSAEGRALVYDLSVRIRSYLFANRRETPPTPDTRPTKYMRRLSPASDPFGNFGGIAGDIKLTGDIERTEDHEMTEKNSH